MNNSIYIASNNKDMFNIEIPRFDSGAVTTGSVAPESNSSYSEFGVVANKSIISFGVMIFCIFIFLLFVFIFKNSKKTQVPQRQIQERRKYNTQERVCVEQSEEIYEQRQNETALYRHNSKKRSSLSTPTSINKCIRAFLENTREN